MDNTKQKTNFNYALLCAAALLMVANTASAVPNGITFQAKILQPNGSAMEVPAVDFRMTTFSPNTSCVLYVETFGGVSMTSSGGVALLKLGAGTPIYSGATTSYPDVFNNLSPSLNCQAGGTYTPAATDARKIVMQFNDGTAAGWQTINPVEINSVPFAHYASESAKVGGHPASDFIIAANNLSNVASPATARTNLGSTFTGDALFTAATPAAARTSLGLGTGSVLDVGTAANNLVQLDVTAKVPAALLPTSATVWNDAGSGKINYNGGAVSIGTATSTTLFNVESTGSTGPVISIRNTAGGTSTFPGLDISKFRGNGIPRIRFFNGSGTSTAPAATTAAATLGSLDFRGQGDTTGFYAASIGVTAQTAFTDTSTPTIMGFSTTAINTVASTERMRIDSTGNIGINSTVPTARLFVNAAAAASSGAITVTGTNGSSTITLSANYTLNIGDYLIPTTTTGQARTLKTSGTGTSYTVTPPLTADITAETFTVYTPTASLNASAAAPAKLFVQGSTGNVGINTRTPLAPLEVAGTVNTPMTITRATNTANSAVGIGFGELDSASLPVVVANIFAAMSTNTTTAVNSYLHFDVLTAGALSEKVRISANGRVGIGTAGATEMLDVVGNIKSSGCIYYASSFTGTCASDERIKKDVQNFDLGLKELLGINPVHFKYNGLAGFQDDGKIQLGVIAQQVEKAAPSLIKREMIQMHEDDLEKTEIKVVDYGAFTYVAINAIKQFYAKWSEDSAVLHREIASIKDEEIKNLKLENAKIKARLDRLEKRLTIND